MGDIQVTQVMDKEYAARLNKKDGDDDYNLYEAGDLTPRFEGDDAAIAHSLEVIKERWPFVTMVFMDNPGMPAQWVMFPDQKMMDKFNHVYEEFEKCYIGTNDPWAAGRGDIIDDLYAQWDELYKSIK